MPNRFSDRIGVTRLPELATYEFSDDLRVALWNTFQPILFYSRPNHIDWHEHLVQVHEFLHWRTHDTSYVLSGELVRLERWYFGENRKWYELYNLVDFVARQFNDREGQFLSLLNGVLQSEGSPYRFVDGILTTITDDNELQAVRDALAASDRFAGARTHLTRALELLGARPQPDFRNAIKEAISSVESTLKILTMQDHADLAESLREFARTHPIHGALVRGLDALYGYTSNEHGLRHSLLEADAKVGFAEAKFMIVACAAFVSFLITLEAQ
jgi:hypothetical protein